MITTSLMFTVLPRGRSGNQVRLSLFVTPKITGAVNSPRLDKAAAMLLDLPSMLSKASFGVFFGRPENEGTCLLDPAGDEHEHRFDSQLWKTFFAPGTLVEAPAAGFERASFSSFGTSLVHDDINRHYQKASQSLTPPTVGSSGSPELTTRVTEVARELRRTDDSGKSLIPKSGIVTSGQQIGSGSEKTEYLRAAVFYNRGDWRKNAGVARPEAQSKDYLEFHEIVGGLADHPKLLRRLGLVIDLVLDLTTVKNIKSVDDIALHSFVYVNSKPISDVFVGKVSIIAPKTEYSLAPQSFTSAVNGAVTDSSTLSNEGMLPLSGKAHFISHLDIDHAVNEFNEFATASEDAAMTTAATEVKLPALRTAGIGIYRNNREADYPVSLNRQETFKTPDQLTFFANDLVRGYRFDVSEMVGNSWGPWKSLCKRVTTVSFDDPKLADLDLSDEGVVKASSLATTNDHETSGYHMLNAHEGLCRWNGWSLVATRPGRPAGESNFVENSGSPVGMPVALRVRAEPGSLPRLRFGHTYSFRGRATDLAGNDLANAPSATPTSAEPNAQSEPITLKRYEPVSPPTLLLRNALTEGESLEHVVIRSNPYAKVPQDAKAYANAANLLPKTLGALNGPMNPYGATSERHVAAPKTSFQLAEMHGKLDTIFKGTSTTAAQVNRAWAIATKEEGSFYDSTMTDTSGSTPVTRDSGCMLVTPVGAVSANSPNVGIKPMPPRPDRSETLLPGQYVIYPQSSVRVPYLPDPNASGIALHDLPTGTFTQPFSAAPPWPDVKAKRLVLEGGAQGTKPSVIGQVGAEDLVRVVLAPGTRTTLRYGSTVKDASVMEHATDASDSMRNDILNGKHSLVSPGRDIVFVHAVQQPMAPTYNIDPKDPNPLKINARNAGDTSITFGADFPIKVDGPSSNHVDFVASWQEMFDGHTDSSDNPLEHPLDYKTHILSANLIYQDVATKVPTGTVQSFGDTKRRDVVYKSVATTRYREYFPTLITSDVTKVTNESINIPFTVNSTARPPAPKVLYSVPNFLWTETLGASTVSQRSGGIRVYADRGWFASGWDERLAVVLTNKGAAISNPAMVSVWGNDPTRFANIDLPVLTKSSFAVDAASVYDDVPTAEDPNSKVTIVTFKPQFHPERRIWYFDIPFAPGASYFPFARLALARYQPCSIPGLHLSNIVLGEFTQISAPRTATVTPSAGKFAIQVDGIGGGNVKLVDGALDIKAGTGEWRRGASGHVVKAELQESLLARADELDYTVRTSITLTPYAGSGAKAGNPVVSYKGTLNIPASLTTSAAHRIVIKEYERYQTDAEDGVSKGPAEVAYGAGNVPYTERVIYSAAIKVSI